MKITIYVFLVLGTKHYMNPKHQGLGFKFRVSGLGLRV